VAQEVAGARVDVRGAVDPVRQRRAAGHALHHLAELGGVNRSAEAQQVGDLRDELGIGPVDGDEIARLQNLEQVRLLERRGEVLAHLSLHRAQRRVHAQGGDHAVRERRRRRVRRRGFRHDVGGEHRRVQRGQVRRGVAVPGVRRLLLFRGHGLDAGDSRDATRRAMRSTRRGAKCRRLLGVRMLTMSAHRRYAPPTVLFREKPAFITNRGKPGFKTQRALDSP
jgi:hypothetical protein